MATVRWRAPGGWVVDTIHLTATTRPEDAGSWYRLTRDGVFVTQVRTPAALTEFVNLADLTEEKPNERDDQNRLDSADQVQRQLHRRRGPRQVRARRHLRPGTTRPDRPADQHLAASARPPDGRP